MLSIKKILVAIGRVQTIFFMGLIYYLVMGTMAVLYQLLKREKQLSDSYWIKREKVEEWNRYLKRQF
jgi:hypothetical protein